jgi:capsular exopolysaccharide synthesis family protein
MSANPSWPASSGASQSSASTSDFDLDFGRVFFAHKLLMIVFTLIGIGVAYYQFTRATPVFESTARMSISRNDVTIANSEMRSGVHSSRETMATYLELIRSPLVTRAAVAKRNIHEWTSMQNVSSPADLISSRLTAWSPDKSPEILVVSYTSPNQSDASQILSAVISSFIDEITRAQRGQRDELARIIESARDMLENELKAKEEAYQEFRQSSRLLFAGESRGVNSPAEMLRSIEAEIQAIEVEKVKVDAAIKQFDDARNQGQSQAKLILMARHGLLQNELKHGDSASVRTPEEANRLKLDELYLEKAELLDKVGPRHPEVLKLERKIQIYSQLSGDENRGSFSTGLVLKADPVDLYRELLADQYNKLAVQQDKLVQLQRKKKQDCDALLSEELRDIALREDKERTKQLFETVLAQMKAFNLSKDSGTARVTVLNEPSQANQVAPVFYQFLVTGAAAGFLVALLVSIWIEVSDRSFRSPADVANVLAMPVVGHIPLTEVRLRKKELRDETIHPMLVTYHKPESWLAESYRSVRSSLFLGVSSREYRIIQITSADPGDGKSTLSANLAVTIAMAGKRCLLIDADCRRPSQHRLFGLESEPGLSDAIRGDGASDEVVRATVVNNLWLMTAGRTVKNPSELLHDQKFSEMLLSFQQQYDFIIVDSPPVLAVTDPAIISQNVDGVMLVVKPSRSARLHSLRASDNMRLVGARFLGAVMSMVPQETSPYGTYRYRYTYRPYGYRYYASPESGQGETTQKHGRRSGPERSRVTTS